MVRLAVGRLWYRARTDSVAAAPGKPGGREYQQCLASLGRVQGTYSLLTLVPTHPPPKGVHVYMHCMGCWGTCHGRRVSALVRFCFARCEIGRAHV